MIARRNLLFYTAWVCVLVGGIVVFAWPCVDLQERAVVDRKIGRLARETCGEDVTFSYSRFGVASDRICLKVQCWSLSERAMRESVVCEKEPK